MCTTEIMHTIASEAMAYAQSGVAAAHNRKLGSWRHARSAVHAGVAEAGTPENPNQRISLETALTPSKAAAFFSLRRFRPTHKRF